MGTEAANFEDFEDQCYDDDDDDYDMLASPGPDIPLRDIVAALPEPCNQVASHSAAEEVQAQTAGIQWNNTFSCDVVARNESHEAQRSDGQAVDQGRVDLTNVHGADPHQAGGLPVDHAQAISGSQESVPLIHTIQLQPAAYFDLSVLMTEGQGIKPNLLLSQPVLVVATELTYKNVVAALNAFYLNEEAVIRHR